LLDNKHDTSESAPAL